MSGPAGALDGIESAVRVHLALEPIQECGPGFRRAGDWI
jgi:hypothetical protein